MDMLSLRFNWIKIKEIKNVYFYKVDQTCEKF